MSRVQLDGVAVAPQWCSQHPGSMLSLSLEEICHLLPSLYELATIHYDVFRILQHENLSQNLTGSIPTTRIRQPVRWVGPRPAILTGTVSAKSGFSRSWGPLPSHLQRLFSNESKAVKNSLAQGSSSSAGLVVNTTLQPRSGPLRKKPGGPKSMGSPKTKETRVPKSLQGDWSF